MGYEQRLEEWKSKLAKGGEEILPSSTKLPPVPVTFHVESGDWILLADYSYKDESTGVELTVKLGFPFDLSSTPRIVWPLIAPFELSIVAPLFHDALYRHGGVAGKFLELSDPDFEFSRRQSDRLFYHHMTLEGVRRWRRYPAQAAVRSLGWSRFQEPGTYYSEAA